MLDSIAVHTGYHFVGLCTLGTNGSGQGYTFVNFALMYLIGASLRLLDIRIKKRYSLSGIILLSALLALAGKFTNVDQYAWAYCNPLVIALAVAIFLLFREFTIRSRVINFLAKGSFTCFLLHMFFLPHYRIPQAVQSSALFLIGHILFTTITIYLLCFVAYLIYDFLSKPIIRLIDLLFQKMKLTILVEEASAEKE